MILPCLSGELIPQKGKMGFEQRLIKGDLADCESTAVIPADGIFTSARRQLSNAALIEYINQLNAAARGYDALIHHRVAQKGFFVGLQEAEFFHPVYAGEHLVLKGRVVDEVNQVSFVEGSIERNGQTVAVLVTKLYEVKDAAEFELLTKPNDAAEPTCPVHSEGPAPPLWFEWAMQHNLYRQVQKMQIRETEIEFELALPQDFEAFDGHFPGKPILPGILFLEIGRLGLELLLQHSVSFTSLRRMKIGTVVFPNQRICCMLRVEQPNGVAVFFKTPAGRDICRYNGYFREGYEG